MTLAIDPDWKGVFANLVTPAAADGSVDAARLVTLVDRLVATGVQGLTSLGSTGEFAHLAQQQRKTAIRTVVETTSGRVPAIAGTGEFSTADVVSRARRTDRLGVDGLLIIMIMLVYGQSRDEENLAYVGAVAGETGLPLMLYNYPSLCHVAYGEVALEDLAVLPTFHYVKEATGALSPIARSPRLAQLGLKVFASSPVSPVATMLTGAVGWMAGPSCVFHEESAETYRRCTVGDWQVAMDLECAITPALEIFRRLDPARATKALLGMMRESPLPPRVRRTRISPR